VDDRYSTIDVGDVGRHWTLIPGRASALIDTLRRAPEEPDASCWLAGDGWWLSNAPVSESSLAGSRDGQRPLKEI
jgi:hypothetical protein